MHALTPALLLALIPPALPAAPAPAQLSWVTVSGTVFYDADGNGQQASWEKGLANRTVILRDVLGGDVAKTTTNNSGSYTFSGLMPGGYNVGVSLYSAENPTTSANQFVWAYWISNVNFGVVYGPVPKPTPTTTTPRPTTTTPAPTSTTPRPTTTSAPPTTTTPRPTTTSPAPTSTSPRPTTTSAPVTTTAPPTTTPRPTTTSAPATTTSAPPSTTSAPPTTTSAPPTSTPVPTTTTEPSFAQRIFELTNEERRKAGLPDFKPDACLDKGAQDWSDTMSSTGGFYHQDLGWISSRCNFRKTWGENIAKGYQTPEDMMEGWMNSDGHRRNILNPRYTHLGVGFNGDGNYATQNFGA